MPKRMLINARHTEESRVAILQDEKLVDFATETATKGQNKGNIYKGIISKVERSLGAAFVDYGMERHGFLPFGEINPDSVSDKNNRRDGARIEDLVKPRQEILVQVVKEEIGQKGAALSTYISLPGRYLVLMPGTDTGGVSRKIEDEEQRRRLRDTVAALKPPPGFGIIVRTAGLDRSRIELQKDLQYLSRVWSEIDGRYQSLREPGLVHREPELAIRTLRDYFSPDVEEVLIDNKEVYQRALEFFTTFMPRSEIALKLYQGTRPLFSLYAVEEQVNTIYQRKVSLKAGGTIVVDPTEALVSIDVNSSKATQERGREETAYRVNLEAAEEVARQVRLRDLGGLVVVDFIDMRDRKHMRDVERRFRNALKDDKARVKVGKISGFGLMEMSRQRLRPDTLDQSHRTCPMCNGSRLVATAENQALSALRKIQEAAAQGDLGEVKGSLLADGLLYLLNQKREEVLRLEKDYNIRITLSIAKLPDDCRLDFVKRDYRAERQEALERERARPSARYAELARSEPKADDGDDDDDDEADSDEKSEVAEGDLAGAPAAASAEGEGDDGKPGDKRRRRRRRRGRRRKGRGENGALGDSAEGSALGESTRDGALARDENDAEGSSDDAREIDDDEDDVDDGAAEAADDSGDDEDDDAEERTDPGTNAAVLRARAERPLGEGRERGEGQAPREGARETKGGDERPRDGQRREGEPRQEGQSRRDGRGRGGNRTRGGRGEDRGRSGERGRDGGARRDERDRQGDRGARPQAERSRGDRPRDDRPREERPREDRPREDRPPRDDRARDDRLAREDRPRDDRVARDDRPREERTRDERPREERPREERVRDDRDRDERPRAREDRARDERPRDRDDRARGGDRVREDRDRDDRPRSREDRDADSGRPAPDAANDDAAERPAVVARPEAPKAPAASETAPSLFAAAAETRTEAASRDVAPSPKGTPPDRNSGA